MFSQLSYRSQLLAVCRNGQQSAPFEEQQFEPSNKSCDMLQNYRSTRLFSHIPNVSWVYVLDEKWACDTLQFISDDSVGSFVRDVWYASDLWQYGFVSHIPDISWVRFLTTNEFVVQYSYCQMNYMWVVIDTLQTYRYTRLFHIFQIFHE